MRYTVIWSNAASATLLGHLLRAADKPGHWSRIRDIESRLRLTPGTEGESRDGVFRILFVRPFSLLFQIDEANRRVMVEEVSWVGM